MVGTKALRDTLYTDDSRRGEECMPIVVRSADAEDI